MGIGGRQLQREIACESASFIRKAGRVDTFRKMNGAAASDAHAEISPSKAKK
jgi:hypothetical protein